MAREFKKKTGVTVDISVVSWSDLLPKLQAAIAGNNGPDVSETGDTWAGQLSASGGFVPWTAAAYRAIGGKGKFIPSLLAATGDPGKPAITVPEAGESYAMYYNTKLFREAGIAAPPKTWTEFVTDAKKLTNPKKGVWGVTADMSNVPAMETWDWIMAQQFGGRYFASPTKDVATVDSAADVRAAQSFLSWIGPDRIMAPNNSSYNSDQAEIQFAHGKAGMIFTQSPTVFAASGMSAGDWAPAEVPVASSSPGPGDDVMSHLDVVTIGVFKSSKHLAADYAWIKFLTSRAPQTTIAKAYGFIPAITSASKDQVFQRNANDRMWLTIQSKFAEPMPTQADSGTVEEAYASAIGQVADQVAESGHLSRAQVETALRGVESTARAREEG